jgi:4-amino-4-deoxy-L-arabinose transferase-like glycosyltransferase
MEKMEIKRWWWLVLAVVVIWFGTLEYRKLIKPDEGRYAEIPREMVASGDWVTPRLNNLKYFEKPPLQYWATATAYTLLGEHHWTSRLWPALTGFCGLLLVWFAGTRLFGREAGQYATLILGSNLLYVAIGHINTLDMGVTFFLTLGVVGLLLGQQEKTDPRTRRNWIYCAWVALGLAVLSKGLIGLVLPAAALVIYSLSQRDLTPWKHLNLVSGLLLCLLVTAPWFILVMKANPEFFERFFIYEHYTRFSTKELGRYQPWYYFIPILLAGMVPWTILMIDTLLRTWKESASISKAFNPERFLLIWVVFIYVFFSISGSKLPSYLLPIFPALALLMGKRLAEMREQTLRWQLAPILLVPLATLGFVPFTDRFAETPLKVEMFRDYATWAAVAALVLLLGLISGMVLLSRRKKSLAVLVVALSSLIGVQIVVSGHDTVARWRSAYHIAESIRPYVKPNIPLYSVGTYEQTLPFYLKRTFTLVDYQNEMAFGIMQEPQRWIPDIASFAKIWNTQPAALAIMPVELYPNLIRQGFAMKIIFEDTQFIVVIKP